MVQLLLKIVTPEKEIFNDEVDMVTATTTEGEIGILPHHVNLMTQLMAGELRIKKGDKTTVMATGSGLLQMADNILTIATDMAENEADIDEKAAEEARKRAQEALEQTQTDEEYATALANLEKALAQLRVKRRHHTSH
jgi:F-type H+-transporting ATPase subunit epsilon